MSDYISRADAIEAVLGLAQLNGRVPTDSVIFQIKALPSAEQTEYKLPGHDDVMEALGNMKLEFTINGTERIRRINKENL